MQFLGLRGCALPLGLFRRLYDLDPYKGDFTEKTQRLSDMLQLVVDIGNTQCTT